MEELLQKALQLADISGILIQPEIDREIQHLVDYQNPLRQNLARRRGVGEFYQVNRRHPSGIPAAFIDDTEAVPEATGTYERVQFFYKTIGTKGKISRKAAKVSQNYVNLVREEIEAKTEEYRNYEEWALFWGRIADNAKQFDGLYELIRATASQHLVTSGDINEDLMDQLIGACKGRPNMLLCSDGAKRRLKALLQSRFRWVEPVEVRGGFRLPAWDDIPIYVSTQIPDTCKVGADGKLDLTGGLAAALTGGTTTVIFCIETPNMFVSELTPVGVSPLDRVTTQYSEFEIISDQVLVMKNPLFHSMLSGIAI